MTPTPDPWDDLDPLDLTPEWDDDRPLRTHFDAVVFWITAILFAIAFVTLRATL
jgi:hypothetical protein